jgi:hypothetical protein
MRSTLGAIAFAATAVLAMASDASAQGYVTMYRSAYQPPATATYPADYVPPYSYWAAPAPYPPRLYVGPVGDFAYFGRPYGHAYDFWTWQSLNYNGAALNRYYYPPLGR